ncbi:hypothetical protein [Rossellomorea marisflavi]|uniref:hypothetical protein n=1 Tax=Rossellomorea marisflavi TaxID=189381 RepID=UPI003FA0018D
MFPEMINSHGYIYYPVSRVPDSVEAMKKLLKRYPYGLLVLLQKIEEQPDTLTKFSLLYSEEFEENVVLYDISNQVHTTITIEISTLIEGYLEEISIGRVDRYPLRLYRKAIVNE